VSSVKAILSHNFISPFVACGDLGCIGLLHFKIVCFIFGLLIFAAGELGSNSSENGCLYEL
jgi:hypothetical protein